MKIKFFALGTIILLAGALAVVPKLKLKETIIIARYEMLACEGCNHMTVERSKDQSLVGKTIIPVSSLVNIDQLIDSVALTKETLCLRGRPYRFSWNFFDDDPNGVRFKVTAIEGAEVCVNLNSKLYN